MLGGVTRVVACHPHVLYKEKTSRRVYSGVQISGKFLRDGPSYYSEHGYTTLKTFTRGVAYGPSIDRNEWEYLCAGGVVATGKLRQGEMTVTKCIWVTKPAKLIAGTIVKT